MEASPVNKKLMACQQEIDGGSSGREIGTLGDSQGWEVCPRLGGSQMNETEER